jgi:hypothetical protein
MLSQVLSGVTQQNFKKYHPAIHGFKGEKGTELGPNFPQGSAD